MGVPARSRQLRIDSIARAAHIPNTVNHYPVILGRAIQLMGLPGHRDTREGTHAGPNYCPYQQWH